MYEELPFWLKPGVKKWNERSIVLSNGSIIFSSATSESSIRGYSVNLVYCLSGQSKITIQDDNGEIKNTTINELCNITENESIFLDNKYTKTYWNIIEKAKKREKEPSIKTEKHHIFPKSIFGDNDLLVYLTIREHFVVHKLLIKMTTGQNKAKMVFACFLMAKKQKDFIKLSSRFLMQYKEDVSFEYPWVKGRGTRK